LVARVLPLQDHRIELEIVQQLINSQDLSTEVEPHIDKASSRYSASATAVFGQHSADRASIGGSPRVRRRTIRQVTILQISGRLSDVIGDLDHAIQLALARGPHGVVCDLTNVLDGAEPGAVEMLATEGRHVRDWPGSPVAVACLDPHVREVLGSDPLGRHLMVSASLLTGITSVLATPILPIRRLRLAAHPTAPRAAQDFVTATLQEWLLGSAAPFARRVIKELVASSSIDAGTDMDVSVVWDRGALRVAVRDRGPALVGQRPAALKLDGRTLTVVAGLSRACGVMPTDDGGKVAWAVLDAPRRNSIQVRNTAHPFQFEANAQSRSSGTVRLLPSARWWRSRASAPSLATLASAHKHP
jgi:hypothetical protein